MATEGIHVSELCTTRFSIPCVSGFGTACRTPGAILPCRCSAALRIPKGTQILDTCSPELRKIGDRLCSHPGPVCSGARMPKEILPILFLKEFGAAI
jgi:hypothetical protein